MSEGPQVRLQTEWLHRELAGRPVLASRAGRPELEQAAARVVGRRVSRCFCKGKHILAEFKGGLFLHNHLLMRGKWRRTPGDFLLLPPEVWLTLCVGNTTVYNVNGQVLEALDGDRVRSVLEALGPDVMTRPFPATAVRRALANCAMPIAEALLDQSVVCGVGNVAKSEVLYAAGLDPRRPAYRLTEKETAKLLQAVPEVMWASYDRGGRWLHTVYRRAGKPCPACGTGIRMLRLPPSRRSIYFCPKCQRDSTRRGLLRQQPLL